MMCLSTVRASSYLLHVAAPAEGKKHIAERSLSFGAGSYPARTGMLWFVPTLYIKNRSL